VLVDRPSFLETPRVSGAQGLGGASLTLRPKQILQDVVVRVAPSSVVAGRVFEEDGDAGSDFHVQAMRYSYISGKRQLQLVAMGVTNDLGEYRLHGLSPGSYYIAASAPGGTNDPAQNGGSSAERYVRTYYPHNTDVLVAAPVAVGKGDQVGGIDIWATFSRPVNVRGRALTPAASQLGRDTVVTLTPRGIDSAGTSFDSTVNIKDAEGHFEIRAVPPGAYTISALLNEKDEQYAGTQSVEVRNTDVDNLDIIMNKATQLSGHIRVDGDKPLPLNSVRVLLEPDSNLITGSLVGDVKSDGVFSISGVLPDQYTLEVFGLPEEFYVKKIQVGMEEIEARKIDFRRASSVELVLSSSSGSVRGSVTDGEQRAASGVQVVVVPALEHRAEHDLYKIATSNKEGQFKIVGIAPGEYKLFALEGTEPDAYLDPDFIAALENYGETLKVEENSSNIENLKVLTN
jgi:hypothetical protein